MDAIASPAIHALLTGLSEGLRAEFGPRLRFVRLFGSWARGQATEISDIDVAVVIEGLRPSERSRLFDIAAEIQLEHERFVSMFVSSGERFDEMLRREQPVYLDIISEGIPA